MLPTARMPAMMIRNRWNTRLLTLWCVAMVLSLTALSCGEESVDESGEVQAETQTVEYVDESLADHRPERSVIIQEDRVEEYFSAEGKAHFEFSEPFKQVGFRFDAEPLEGMKTRVRHGDEWSEWETLEPYFSEAPMYNAHLVLDRSADAIQWKVDGQIQFADLSFFDVVTARDELIINKYAEGLTDGIHDEEADGDYASVQQAVAPDDMVTTRHQWNATDPDKICGSVVAPYRMAIHHTASPSDDGDDPGARMRQMQNYHMNTLGWCDIGYHFVVAQSGEILQGRSRSDRPGAHVGGQNSGNVGISMIGNYTNSGPPDVQFDGVVTMVKWVHDEHGVDLDSNAIRGHRDWPNQTTACPGDVGVTYVDDIISEAADPPDPPDPAEYDVDVDVSVHGLDDFYTQGSSDGIGDAFSGDEFTAEIRVTNQSNEPIREVALDYEFDGVGVEATDYVIESDHPEYDQSSWEVNDANDEPANPDPGAMGNSGTLEMYAFSPDETKRVVIDMVATDYNIGMADFAGVRGWVRNIEDVYEVQGAFGEEPSTNETEQGALLQDSERVDVLSRDEWQFRSDHEDDLEGWSSGGGTADLRLNTGYELLAQEIMDDDAYLTSPEWTRVDADSFDEMVLRFRSHDGEHTRAVYWSDGDEDFDEQRSLRFEAYGDSEKQTLVIPLGDHPGWQGQIERMRLVQLDGEAPDEGDSGWYDIDHVYFQDATEGITSSDSLDVADAEPVEVQLPDDVSEEDPDGEDPDEPQQPEAEAEFPADAATVEVNEGLSSGCVNAGNQTNSATVLLWILMMGTGFALWRLMSGRLRESTVSP